MLNEPIIIKINNSKQLFSFLISIHVLALCSLLLTPISFSLTIIFVVLISFSLYYYLSNCRKIQCVVEAKDNDNEWILMASNGSQLNCNLSNKTYISDYVSLLVFTYQEQAGSEYVVLMRDSVATGLLSLLKLRLKINSDKH